MAQDQSVGADLRGCIAKGAVGASGTVRYQFCSREESCTPRELSQPATAAAPLNSPPPPKPQWARPHILSQLNPTFVSPELGRAAAALKFGGDVQGVGRGSEEQNCGLAEAGVSRDQRAAVLHNPIEAWFHAGSGGRWEGSCRF